MDISNVILQILRCFKLRIALFRVIHEVFVTNRATHTETITICLAKPFWFKIDVIFLIIRRLLPILYSVIVLTAVRRDNEWIQIFLHKSPHFVITTLQVGHLLSLYSNFQCKRHTEHMSLWLQGPKANSLISRSHTLQNILFMSRPLFKSRSFQENSPRTGDSNISAFFLSCCYIHMNEGELREVCAVIPIHSESRSA